MSAVTTTGLEQVRALYAAMPERFDALSLRVARGAANGMVVTARRLLDTPNPPLKGPSHSEGRTAAAIEIVEDPDNKAVHVNSSAPRGVPANEPIWREHGTVKQPARPYMKPAADEAREVFVREHTAAIEGLCREMSS